MRKPCLAYGVSVLPLLGCFISLGKVAHAELDLNPFEDDDCLEKSETFDALRLLHSISDLLDAVLYAGDADGKEFAWTAARGWIAQHGKSLMQTVDSAVSGPYCEAGKVAWFTARCLLLLGQGGEESPERTLECAEDLDQGMLREMTPRPDKWETRFHLLLRSPWPVFRLLDQLVRLHPATGSTRMGGCHAFQKWNSDPDIFDWPLFKSLYTSAVDELTSNPNILQLRPEDGPLSVQYRARWLRIHSLPEFRTAVEFSNGVFESYRTNHYQAGCHLGVLAAYILQIVVVHLRDIQGETQRLTCSVAQLFNLHAPVSHVVRTDWPVFRGLYVLSLLQRSPPTTHLAAQVQWQRSAVQQLQGSVSAAAQTLQRSHEILFLSAAWGIFASFADRVTYRWEQVLTARAGKQTRGAFLMLALDNDAAATCRHSFGEAGEGELAQSGLRHSACLVESDQVVGIEGVLAKYIALATVVDLGLPAVWVDLDVYPLHDISASMAEQLVKADTDAASGIIFAQHLLSESASPAVVLVKPGATQSQILLDYAYWLRENPYMLDHQGWDLFFENKDGDHSGGFDYKGRNVSAIEDKGPRLSFIPPRVQIPRPLPLQFLPLELFGSGDGWFGRFTGSHVSLGLFHFWGASQSQSELFELFFPLVAAAGPAGPLPDAALQILRQYHRKATQGASLTTYGSPTSLATHRQMHLVAISYAHGCCARSLAKNRRKALEAGVTEARAYGYADLDVSWKERNAWVLSQKKGAGWWLWKPHLILKTLLDPTLPWSRGIVLWTDAGNYVQSDPRPFLAEHLAVSDVIGLRLKSCIEADWTSARTMNRLQVSSAYNIADRPQIGAYFLAFRKTPLSISFVQAWLKAAEDPVALLGGYIDSTDWKASHELGHQVAQNGTQQIDEIHSFQRHQADQSVLSVLFKQWGFQAASLSEGHKVVALERWRE